MCPTAAASPRPNHNRAASAPRTVNQVTVNSPPEQILDEEGQLQEARYIFFLTRWPPGQRTPACKLDIRVNGQPHTWEIDSGALVKLVGVDVYANLPDRSQLTDNFDPLSAWGTHVPISIPGVCWVAVSRPGMEPQRLLLIVSSDHGTSLIGRN